MHKSIAILLLLLVPANAACTEKLAYHSDYFSFVGQDATGFVVFALDNNRGVDGADYQAEHFGVLFDQRSGWIKLNGAGAYANTRGILERIPDSAAFTFEGHPKNGLVIRSRPNSLDLMIGPLDVQLSESEGQRSVNWAVAGATLYWKGRTISGRVIHEHLVYLDWNRLTRKYPGTWDNFQGFYLAVQAGGTDTWSDLYLRSQGAEQDRRTKGFANTQQWSGVLRSARFEAYDKALNWGLYRWPQRWEIAVKPMDADDGRAGQLSLRQVSRQNQGNWFIGGFAMSVVAGELVLDGITHTVLGFAELIK